MADGRGVRITCTCWLLTPAPCAKGEPLNPGGLSESTAQNRTGGRHRSAHSILHFMKGNHRNCRSLDRDLNPVQPRSRPMDRGCVLVTNQRPGNGKRSTNFCEIRQRTLDANQDGSHNSQDSTRMSFVNERCKSHITVFDQSDVRLDYTATGEIPGLYSGQVLVVLADSSLEYS